MQTYIYIHIMPTNANYALPVEHHTIAQHDMLKINVQQIYIDQYNYEPLLIMSSVFAFW